MIRETEALNALMDTLLPGGEGFPAASETGMRATFLARLRQEDAAVPTRFVAAIAAQGNVPDSPEAWREALARLESLEPKLFDTLRRIAYLTYYEQPKTIAAIRALGFNYNVAPLPEGYPTEPFEPERDAPRHHRGRWIPTADVKPVDVSDLDLEELQ